VLRDTVRDESLRGQIEVVVRNANRLMKIVEDLSNVSTFENGEPALPQRTVNLDRLIREAAATFQETANKKKIKLAVDLPTRELILEGDAEKLSLAMTNLIENALNYTDRNGHVLITAEMLPGYVKISVIDDGIGIPPKDVQRVFDRFYQVETHLTRRHGGMGLGLSVAKSMIELHHGQIWAESVEGKGSNFSFLLPVKEEEGKTKPQKNNGTLSKPFE
jgi:signal transduction histidine kinase